MEPTLTEGDRLLVLRLGKVKKGDVVVARISGKEIVKRVSRTNGESYELLGDNPNYSTDSRSFGKLTKESILGKMIFKY